MKNSEGTAPQTGHYVHQSYCALRPDHMGDCAPEEDRCQNLTCDPPPRRQCQLKRAHTGECVFRKITNLEMAANEIAALNTGRGRDLFSHLEKCLLLIVAELSVIKEATGSAIRKKAGER